MQWVAASIGVHAQIIEWLLHEIPLTEIAATPSMIVPFAAIVNATTAALTYATASLAEKLEGAEGSLGLGSVMADSNNALVACRNPRELLHQVGVKLFCCKTSDKPRRLITTGRGCHCLVLLCVWSFRRTSTVPFCCSHRFNDAI